MGPETWGFIGTIVGALAAVGGSICTTLMTLRATHAMQLQTHRLAREDRARELQRATLLALQEMLNEQMRLVAHAHIEDQKNFRANPDARPLLSEELDQQLTDLNRKLTLETERITNDELRAKIKNLRRSVGAVVFAQSAADNESAFHAALRLFESTMEDVGKLLRTYL